MSESQIHDLRREFIDRRMLANLKRRAAGMNEGQMRVESAASVLITHAAQLVGEHLVRTPEQFAAELGIDISETGLKSGDVQMLVLALLERAATSHRDYMKETEIPDSLPGA